MTALSDRLSVAVRTALGSAGDWITASFAGMTVLGGVCSVLPADLRTACGPRAGYRNTSRSGGQTRSRCRAAPSIIFWPGRHRLRGCRIADHHPERACRRSRFRHQRSGMHDAQKNDHSPGARCPAARPRKDTDAPPAQEYRPPALAKMPTIRPRKNNGIIGPASSSVTRRRAACGYATDIPEETSCPEDINCRSRFAPAGPLTASRQVASATR